MKHPLPVSAWGWSKHLVRRRQDWQQHGLRLPLRGLCVCEAGNVPVAFAAETPHLARRQLVEVAQDEIGCSTVMNKAYRHIHTALRYAMSGDGPGLGSRGADPRFPPPPPAPAMRFPALLPPRAALMLPSAGPRGAHTARSDRPCGTTTDGPDPAPTRRSAVASAHPKPGYQRGQARACHFHAGYARPIYLLFRGSHYCQMTIPIPTKIPAQTSGNFTSKVGCRR